MKNLKSLSAKLATYGLASLALLSQEKADAQIQYTDFDPDKCMGGLGCPSVLSINVDGDTDFDFTFYQSHIASSYYGCFTDDYAMLGIGPDDFVSPLKFDAGDSISSLITFYSGASLGYIYDGSSPYYCGYSTHGNWPVATIGYAGFKTSSPAGTHYGWMRLSIKNGGTDFTVYDMAVNLTPDEPIVAGDMGCVPPLASDTLFGAGKAAFYWPAILSAEGYQFRISEVGSTETFCRNTTETFVKGKVEAGKSYNWEVRSWCGAGEFSEFSDPQLLSVPILREGEIEQRPIVQATSTEIKINIPPSNGNWTASIYNSSGQLLLTHLIAEGMHTIDKAALPNGIYFLALDGEQFAHREQVSVLH